MGFPLTERIKEWYEKDEIHFAVATKTGKVKIGIASRGEFIENDILVLSVSEEVKEYISREIETNPWIALAPGGQGCVVAPYQLKGLAEFKGDKIHIQLKELYSTKPGPEAGIRMDMKSAKDVEQFERDMGWID